MKRKVTITDKQTGKKTTGEVTLRNEEHFHIQLRNPARVFKNKKAYTRKVKHKEI